jgi:acyl-CoA synthetase (NDP forming)
VPDLKALFWPRSMALVGASADRSIIRGRIVEAVRHHGFDGPIIAVSRSACEIDGLPCVASVPDLPQPVDLAIITIPAAHVPEALEHCAARGVKAAVVISSGFAEEHGEGGARRQRQLTAIAQRHDLALLGPNAEGFLNARLPLAATFSPTVLDVEGGLRPQGHRCRSIAVVSHSGGVGFAFFHRGRPKGLDFSFVVSMGNEAGLDALQVTDYLLEDADTAVVLLFLEGLRDPARLATVACKALTLGKPLVIAKMGSSAAGAAAAASHTASLAGAHRSYQAAFAHHGILAGEDIDQMVDLAAGFAYFHDRLPRGRRVGVVTPSGGAGAWLADICERHGLQVPELDATTRASVDRLLPSYGSSRNPVDITAQAIFQHGYVPAIEAVAASERVDAVVVAASLAHAHYLEKDFDNLARLARELDKPVIFCGYTRAGARSVALLAQAGFPCTTSMPNAARTLAAMASFGETRARAASAAPVQLPQPGFSHRVEEALAAARGTLSEHDTKELLADLGVPVPCGELVQDPDAAAAAALRMACPLALKLQSPDLPHKSEVDGVALAVHGADAARVACERLLRIAAGHVPPSRLQGVRVEPMAAPGVEVIVGLNRDADFGLMLAVGLGGIWVEVLDDLALCPVPVDHAGALALLDRLRARSLLDGLRGTPPCDVTALVELMVRVSCLAAAAGDRLQELDLNPVIVHPRGEGLTVVDALLRVGEQ